MPATLSMALCPAMPKATITSVLHHHRSNPVILPVGLLSLEDLALNTLAPAQKPSVIPVYLLNSAKENF